MERGSSWFGGNQVPPKTPELPLRGRFLLEIQPCQGKGGASDSGGSLFPPILPDRRCAAFSRGRPSLSDGRWESALRGGEPGLPPKPPAASTRPARRLGHASVSRPYVERRDRSDPTIAHQSRAALKIA